MADGKQFIVTINVPDDPIAADEGIAIEVIGTNLPRAHRRVYMDATKTRDQLVNAAMTALAAYIRQQ